jgi:hypothetical protein
MHTLIRCSIAVLALAAASFTHAGQPAGTITKLSGWLMAIQPDGKPKVLSVDSVVEVGDTLVSEEGTYANLVLQGGNEVLIGPASRLAVVRSEPQWVAIALVQGQLRATVANVAARGDRFTIDTGDGSVEASGARFELTYVPLTAAVATARREAYTRASLAALESSGMTDTPRDSAIGELVAQVAPGAPKPPTAPGLPAGLYVSVIDGAIKLSNKVGSQSFTAGQFGYTASITKPPVVVPANPGIKFTPPPTFASNSGGGSGGGSKAAAIDCVVR